MRPSLFALILFASSTVLFAQQPPRGTQPPAPVTQEAPDPQPAASSQTTPDSSFLEQIDVDSRCRILVQVRSGEGKPYSKPRFRQAPDICHIVSPHDTRGYEDIMDDSGILKRTPVHIVECEYVLHNIQPVPVLFVVHLEVHDGWHIDSDPKPVQVVNGLADFPVIAKPGETVRLHVGQRH